MILLGDSLNQCLVALVVVLWDLLDLRVLRAHFLLHVPQALLVLQALPELIRNLHLPDRDLCLADPLPPLRMVALLPLLLDHNLHMAAHHPPPPEQQVLGADMEPDLALPPRVIGADMEPDPAPPRRVLGADMGLEIVLEIALEILTTEILMLM